jgi:hypothetical protein
MALTGTSWLFPSPQSRQAVYFNMGCLPQVLSMVFKNIAAWLINADR